MTRGITEVKHRLDGTEQRFDCLLVRRTPSLAIALYQFDSPVGPIDSYGCFWPRRPYLCYHMVHRADGREWVTRFDVVRDLQLANHEVSYTDLLLDLWVDADGAHWEDEEEVAEAASEGRLGPGDLDRIDRARVVLARRHRSVVRDVRRTLGLASLGALRRRD